MNNIIFKDIANEIDKNQQVWLVTVINTDGSTPGKIGNKMLVRNDGATTGTIGGGTIEKLVIDKILKITPAKPDIWNFDLGGNFTAEKTGMLCGGQQSVLIDPIGNNHTLYIIGGGHCGKALGELAAKCNFNVIIIDERTEYANQITHPHASQTICSAYADVANHINFTLKPYIVVMTHAHKNDELVMRKILGKNYSYLGVIGSKKKSHTIYNNLLQDGFAREELTKVFLPIGLNIGSETPYEIAISILAQLIAIKNNIATLNVNTNPLTI